MNRRAIIEMLLKAIGHIDVHDRMIEELIGIVVGSGYEEKFFTTFSARLKSLSRYGVDVVKQKEFENIGGGIYSMHIAGHGFNIRILYSILPNGDPSLLLSFYERGGKKKTDYTTYKEPAGERFKERLEVHENGDK